MRIKVENIIYDMSGYNIISDFCIINGVNFYCISAYPQGYSPSDVDKHGVHLAMYLDEKKRDLNFSRIDLTLGNNEKYTELDDWDN